MWRWSESSGANKGAAATFNLLLWVPLLSNILAAVRGEKCGSVKRGWGGGSGEWRVEGQVNGGVLVES